MQWGEIIVAAIFHSFYLKNDFLLFKEGNWFKGGNYMRRYGILKGRITQLVKS